MDARRFVKGVNWSGAILNPFRSLGDEVGRSLDDTLESLRVGPDESVLVFLHVATPRVEFTDRGKSAINLNREEDE